MNLNVRLQNINIVILWVMITSVSPFTFFLAIPNHPYKYLAALAFSLFLIQLLRINKIKLGNKIIYIVIFLQLFFTIISYYYFNYWSIYINLSIHFILVGLAYVALQNIFDKYKVIKSYIIILAFMGVLGSIAFMLGITGFLKPYSTHQNIDTRTAYNFILTFSNSVLFVGDKYIIRFAGFFDEPGTFAFYTTMALMLNKLTFNNKKWELVLVITGLFTVSMAYYITLILYYLLFYLKNKKGIIIPVVRNVFIILLIVSSITAINFLSNESPVFSQIKRITIDRFRIAEDNPDRILRGDNRSKLAKLALEAFYDAPFMGHGINYENNPDSSYYRRWFGANIFMPLGSFGIIGVAFLYLHVFYLLYVMVFKAGRYNSDYTKVFIIIFLNYLQRPHAIGFLNHLIILILIDLSISYYKTKKGEVNLQ